MIIDDGEKVLTPKGKAPRRWSVPDLGKYFVDARNSHGLTTPLALCWPSKPARSSNKAEAYGTPQSILTGEVPCVPAGAAHMSYEKLMPG